MLHNASGLSGGLCFFLTCFNNPNSLGYYVPTVLRREGFRITILLPPREHGPAHVHVSRAGSEVVITLNPVRVWSVDRMRTTDILRAVELVEEHQTLLIAEWRKWHG
ncbi:MAG: hypothetical protein C0497_11585 [Gemmatimonas sp.]|nr:hypothetical protein [Gemmatimonas sp.]